MKTFKRIYIETTNVCNLSCSFCPKTRRKNQFMTSEEFEAILIKIKPHTNYIYLHVLGEPLLHPRFQSFLDLANKYEMKVNLTTNATLLEKNQDVLLQAVALRQVNMSLHSFEANDVSFTLEEYVKQIGAFIKRAKDSNVIVSIRLWNMDSTSIKGENELNHQIMKLLQQLVNPEVSIEEALKKKSSVKLFDNIYLNMAQKFEWPDETKVETTEKVFCHGLRDHLGILVDGTVVPCCLDSEGTINLGNIFDTPLQEIISCERATAMYDGFSNRQAVESLCQRCEYATRY